MGMTFVQWGGIPDGDSEGALDLSMAILESLRVSLDPIPFLKYKVGEHRLFREKKHGQHESFEVELLATNRSEKSLAIVQAKGVFATGKVELIRSVNFPIPEELREFIWRDDKFLKDIFMRDECGQLGFLEGLIISWRIHKIMS